MKRTQVNFGIDAAAFTAFLFLLSTGLLLRYQLPAGSGGLQPVGTGRGTGERHVTFLWGWTRHEWGQVHYWIAALLIAVLAVHLLLHWKWIVGVIRGTHGDASGLRFGVGLASLIALALLAAAPLLAPTKRVTRGELEQQRSAVKSTRGVDSTADLRGSMSVVEVADAVDVSVPELLNQMKLPEDVSPDEQIGRLLRQHGLQMSDLRQLLRNSAANDRPGGYSDE